MSSTSLSARQYSIGLLLAGLAAVGFSFKAILVKLAYAAAVSAAPVIAAAAPAALNSTVPSPMDLDAVTLLALRMLYSLPVFAWIAWRESTKASTAFTRKQVAAIFTLGLLGYYGASLFDFMGLMYISAGLERLVLAIYPTLTLMLGVVFFGDKLTPRKLLACGLCYLGIAAAFLHDLSFAMDSTAVWLGSGLVFASAVSYSLYLVGTGRMVAAVGAQRFTAFAMLASTLVTLLHFATTHPLAALAQPARVHMLAAAMAIFSTIIPVFALSAAIRRIGAAHTALIGSSGPLITLLLGWWLLHEPLSAVQLGGLALVLIGVTVISKR